MSANKPSEGAPQPVIINLTSPSSEGLMHPLPSHASLRNQRRPPLSLPQGTASTASSQGQSTPLGVPQSPVLSGVLPGQHSGYPLSTKATPLSGSTVASNNDSHATSSNSLLLSGLGVRVNGLALPTGGLISATNSPQLQSMPPQSPSRLRSGGVTASTSTSLSSATLPPAGISLTSPGVSRTLNFPSRPASSAVASSLGMSSIGGNTALQKGAPQHTMSLVPSPSLGAANTLAPSNNGMGGLGATASLSGLDSVRSASVASSLLSPGGLSFRAPNNATLGSGMPNNTYSNNNQSSSNHNGGNNGSLGSLGLSGYGQSLPGQQTGILSILSPQASSFSSTTSADSTIPAPRRPGVPQYLSSGGAHNQVASPLSVNPPHSTHSTSYPYSTYYDTSSATLSSPSHPSLSQLPLSSTKAFYQTARQMSSDLQASALAAIAPLPSERLRFAHGRSAYQASLDSVGDDHGDEHGDRGRNADHATDMSVSPHGYRRGQARNKRQRHQAFGNDEEIGVPDATRSTSNDNDNDILGDESRGRGTPMRTRSNRVPSARFLQALIDEEDDDDVDQPRAKRMRKTKGSGELGVTGIRHDNPHSAGSSPVLISRPTMVTESSLSGAPVQKIQKGLRHFSLKVCEKVEMLGVTTYTRVADELVKELANPALGETGYDEKNIRRRVYDALNVLMALGTIIKQKKEIIWSGSMGTVRESDDAALAQMEAEHEKKRQAYEQKVKMLQRVVSHYIAMRNLIAHNKRIELLQNQPLHEQSRDKELVPDNVSTTSTRTLVSETSSLSRGPSVKIEDKVHDTSAFASSSSSSTCMTTGSGQPLTSNSSSSSSDHIPSTPKSKRQTSMTDNRSSLYTPFTLLSFTEVPGSTDAAVDVSESGCQALVTVENAEVRSTQDVDILLDLGFGDANYSEMRAMGIPHDLITVLMPEKHTAAVNEESTSAPNTPAVGSEVILIREDSSKLGLALSGLISTIPPSKLNDQTHSLPAPALAPSPARGRGSTPSTEAGQGYSPLPGSSTPRSPALSGLGGLSALYESAMRSSVTGGTSSNDRGPGFGTNESETITSRGYSNIKSPFRSSYDQKSSSGGSSTLGLATPGGTHPMATTPPRGVSRRHPHAFGSGGLVIGGSSSTSGGGIGMRSPLVKSPSTATQLFSSHSRQHHPSLTQQLASSSSSQLPPLPPHHSSLTGFAASNVVAAAAASALMHPPAPHLITTPNALPFGLGSPSSPHHHRNTSSHNPSAAGLIAVTRAALSESGKMSNNINSITAQLSSSSSPSLTSHRNLSLSQSLGPSAFLSSTSSSSSSSSSASSTLPSSSSPGLILSSFPLPLPASTSSSTTIPPSPTHLVDHANTTGSAVNDDLSGYEASTPQITAAGMTRTTNTSANFSGFGVGGNGNGAGKGNGNGTNHGDSHSGHDTGNIIGSGNSNNNDSNSNNRFNFSPNIIKQIEAGAASARESLLTLPGAFPSTGVPGTSPLTSTGSNNTSSSLTTALSHNASPSLRSPSLFLSPGNSRFFSNSPPLTISGPQSMPSPFKSVIFTNTGMVSGNNSNSGLTSGAFTMAPTSTHDTLPTGTGPSSIGGRSTSTSSGSITG